MLEIFVYAFLSVLVVSLISLIGILSFGVNSSFLKKILIYMISFSAGALFADVFIHMLPEIVESTGFSLGVSFMVVFGIVMSLVLEKIIHWRHCHMPITSHHVHPFSIMSLVGDALHNFIDGIIIGASYLLSIPIGIATTVAVIFHEIPQEIANFGVLVHGGFSRSRALLMNFVTSLTAFFGLLIVLVIGSRIEGIVSYLIAFAAGNFIYIAGSDLIPELHKENKLTQSLIQIFSFVLGVGVIALLIFLE